MQQVKEEIKENEDIEDNEQVQKRNLEKVNFGQEKEGELQGKEFEDQVAQLKKEKKSIRKALDEKDINLLIKEFDIDRFKAIHYLRQNDADVRKTINYILNI